MSVFERARTSRVTLSHAELPNQAIKPASNAPVLSQMPLLLSPLPSRTCSSSIEFSSNGLRLNRPWLPHQGLAGDRAH